MADTQKILTDRSVLSRMDVGFFKIESALTLASGVIIFLLIFLSVVNVLGRWIFSLPVDGYIDWIEQSMAFFALLGIAYTQRQGAHIRMDMVIGRFRARMLWVAELLSVCLMLGITALLIYGSFLHFLRAYLIGDSSVDINLPIWPAKLVVPVALSFLAFRLILQIWGYIRAIIERADVPVALPLIEDAASQAASEADTVGQSERT